MISDSTFYARKKNIAHKDDEIYHGQYKHYSNPKRFIDHANSHGTICPNCQRSAPTTPNYYGEQRCQRCLLEEYV